MKRTNPLTASDHVHFCKDHFDVLPSRPTIEAEDIANNIPLSKSLGFSMRNNFEKYVEEKLLQEQNDISLGSGDEVNQFNTNDDEDDIEEDLLRLKDIADRRRSIRMQSVAGRRRSRSQVARREKLNSQSLLSHREHSLRSSLEQR